MAAGITAAVRRADEPGETGAKRGGNGRENGRRDARDPVLTSAREEEAGISAETGSTRRGDGGGVRGSAGKKSRGEERGGPSDLHQTARRSGVRGRLWAVRCESDGGGEEGAGEWAGVEWARVRGK